MMQCILCLGLNSDIKMAVAHQCMWYLNRHHTSARLTLVVGSRVYQKAFEIQISRTALQQFPMGVYHIRQFRSLEYMLRVEGIKFVCLQ